MLATRARLSSRCLGGVILTRSIPEDFDLFNEVDFALGEIQRCYIDLDKFWVEEICRAVKALETRRVDPDDVKRWRRFKASLEQTIELWKVWIPTFSPCREQT
jgi:hypothetical protein